MPNYTLCLLLKADLSETDKEKVLQEVSKALPDSSKPETISWGKKDLAYPILKQTQAHYYLLNFEANSTTPAALDKKLKLDDRVLRFLVVKRKVTKKIEATKETKATKGTKRTKVAKATKATKAIKAKAVGKAKEKRTKMRR